MLVGLIDFIIVIIWFTARGFMRLWRWVGRLGLWMMPWVLIRLMLWVLLVLLLLLLFIGPPAEKTEYRFEDGAEHRGQLV